MFIKKSLTTSEQILSELESLNIEWYYFSDNEEDIKSAIRKNKEWEDLKENIEYNITRKFLIPRGKSKKYYKDLKDDVQDKINSLKKEWQETYNPFLEIEKEKWMDVKKKLKAIIEINNKEFSSDIQKAKAYPIENLLEFNHSGFCKCPFHKEKTPSCKLNKQGNFVYCFAGCGKKDSIDVYMVLNNVSLSIAIKKLSSWN